MKKYHIVVDVEKCVGCYSCVMACKDEHVGNEWLPYTDAQQKHDQKWIDVERVERGSYPHTTVKYRTALCNHCQNAPCQKKAPDAVRRREDGIVLLDPARAKGNRDLVDACPYGRISWNEELETAQKCTLCAHLLDDGWKEPRCVQACPLRALRVVYCEDHSFDKLCADKGLAPAIPKASGPRVAYKNLHLLDTCFIAGDVVFEDQAGEHCAKNAAVKLIKDGKTVDTATTDFFGGFRFDGLEPGSGTYTVETAWGGKKSVSVKAEVREESVDVGIIRCT